ncbi:GNAT family protein [Dactylosporangium sp. NPDC005555]|uniref:GNAT family N-acetyltransferase n=1 Tax=Dactylosporangium sp. NPDC005555 TaxID=3154889 RepID=UPI0033B5714E
MRYTIRPVVEADWPLAKELRLAALQDPVAPIAFLETYDQVASQPDEFWQGRTATAAEGSTVRQFIGASPSGRWLGTVTVLVEPPGFEDYFGFVVPTAQTHLVGVYVRPEARGTGLAAALFDAALTWSWSLPAPSPQLARLYVHTANTRAQAMYKKAGFTPTGATVEAPTGTEYEYAISRADAAVGAP